MTTKTYTMEYPTSILRKLISLDRYTDKERIKIFSLHCDDISICLHITIQEALDILEYVDEDVTYVTLNAFELLTYARYLKLPIERKFLVKVNNKKIHSNTFTIDNRTFTVVNHKTAAYFA